MINVKILKKEKKIFTKYKKKKSCFVRAIDEIAVLVKIQGEQRSPALDQVHMQPLVVFLFKLWR